jgi:PKD repeat protein
VGTFYVDRDGRGGTKGNDSLTTWSVAARVGDPTKPFASVQAAIDAVATANAGGNDTIRVRREISSSPYAPPTNSGQQVVAKNTLIAHDTSSAEGRPTVDGSLFTNWKNWRIEALRWTNTVRFTNGDYIEFVGNVGRSRSTTDAHTGTLFIQGLNHSLLESNDFEYSGPDVSTLAGEIVPMNFSSGGATTHSDNIIRKNRMHNFPGDFINGPGAVNNGNWVIEKNEFGEALSGTLANGNALHTDVIQMETGPNTFDNVVCAENITYGRRGTGRWLFMGQQGSGGFATGVGKFTNLQIIDNVWHDMDQFALRVFSCPGILVAGNTVWGKDTAPTHGMDIAFLQSTAVVNGSPVYGDPANGTTNARLKGNIISGLRVLNDGGTVTFTSDTGYNMFPAATSLVGYSKRATDIFATPSFIDTTYNAGAGVKPNLRLQSGSRGIDEGPLLSDSAAMTGIPATDADGNARVGTRADIGAYEAGSTGAPPPISGTVEGRGYTRKSIWPVGSPAGNQFNEFVGAMRLLDDSIVIPFIEVTGPAQSATGSDKAPQEVYTRLGVDRASFDYRRDFWSTTNTIRYLRSTDQGATWNTYRVETTDIAEDASAVYWTGGKTWTPNPHFPQAHVVAPNGDWLKRVNGEDIKFASRITGSTVNPYTGSPRGATAFLLRLVGGNPAGSWVDAGSGNDRFFGADPTIETVQISRIKIRDDGKLLAMGQRWPVAAGTRTTIAGAEPYLAVSSDNGSTWTKAVTVAYQAGNRWAPNEGDWVELPNGDLLTIWRSGPIPWNGTSAGAPYSSKYIQVVATRNSSTSYSFQTAAVTPWSAAANPIHPELLKDQASGAILFISQGPENVRVTTDNGTTWSELTFTNPTAGPLATRYYPRSITDSAGNIYIVSHLGGDDYYGRTDQAIYLDRFDLVVTGTRPDGGGGIGGPATGTTEALLPSLVTEFGTGTAWTGLANIIETAGAWATAGLNSTINAGRARQLRAAFSMGLTSQQEARGLTVTMKRSQSGGATLHDETFQVFANGSLQGANKAAAGNWPPADATVTYGSATDLWGATTAAVLDSWMRAPDFAIVLVPKNDTSSGSFARVDWIKAQVAWAQPTTTTAPVAAFTMAPNPAQADQDVTFNATSSTGQIDTYEISYTGGLTFSPMSGPVVIDTFASGTYEVRVRVTGPGGSSVSPVQSLLVEGTATPPIPVLFLNPSSVLAGEAVTATMNQSGGVITKYEIAWDGVTFEDLGATATTAQHTYGSAGTYTVRLRVTGPGGSATTFQRATVNNPDPTDTAPVPALTLLSVPAIAGQVVVADFSGSTGAITKYEIAWTGTTFTDVGVSTTASHTYATAGTYSVILRVTGPGGTNSLTRSLVVQPAVVEPPVVTEPPPEVPQATPDFGRTFAELQQEVMEHGFSAKRYSGRVKTWLNEALGQMARQANTLGLEREVSFTTRSGVAGYEIPGAVVRVISVRDRGYELRNIPVEEVDERIGEQGSPVDYAVFGAGLLLAPTPVVPRTIQVRYRSRPTRMVGDSDYPGIPSAYEDLLLSYALYHAFRSEDDVDMASFYKGEWQQGMAQLRTDLQYPDESQRRQIGGMMGGDAGPRFRRPQ